MKFYELLTTPAGATITVAVIGVAGTIITSFISRFRGKTGREADAAGTLVQIVDRSQNENERMITQIHDAQVRIDYLEDQEMKLRRVIADYQDYVAILRGHIYRNDPPPPPDYPKGLQ